MPGEVPNEAQQQPAVLMPTLVCPGPSRQRDSPILSGTQEEDVEDWLAEYERKDQSLIVRADDMRDVLEAFNGCATELDNKRLSFTLN
ncbi:uncharacterized protein LOC142784970 isoform X2 [Rhipicephalus microplus]|uniref:uncharacterized protein LOC142784970 isoform X2 n=1 Tax=Rhipicephalus microplus TaxID=6941 RepID=UPI003F6B89A8